MLSRAHTGDARKRRRAEAKMNRVIVVGSPRTNGRSAALAEELFEACIEECPDDHISLISLSSLTVLPCEGCNFCMKSEGHACHLGDDMMDIREVLDDADELTIVSPVYFASAPATLKAFLDRLQPYFWTDARHGELRPATLHVIGEGHDPFGFEPLVVTVKSAAFTAGFKLERVLNWVEKISAKGEILDDAQVIEVAWPESSAQVSGRASDLDALGESPVPAAAVDEGTQAAAKASAAAAKAQAGAPKAAVSKAAGKSKNPGVTLNVQGAPKGAGASRGAGSSKQQGGRKSQQGASRGASASKPSGTKKPQQGKRPQGSSKTSQISKKSGNR